MLFHDIHVLHTVTLHCPLAVICYIVMYMYCNMISHDVDINVHVLVCQNLLKHVARQCKYLCTCCVMMYINGTCKIMLNDVFRLRTCVAQCCHVMYMLCTTLRRCPHLLQVVALHYNNVTTCNTMLLRCQNMLYNKKTICAYVTS